MALSSRNNRLSEEGLIKAALFAQILHKPIESQAQEQALIDLGFKVDYVTEFEGRLFAAVWLEGVRLIDNVSL